MGATPVERRLEASSQALASFAQESLAQASSVLVVHRRSRRFRPLCLIEIPLFGCCFLALIPVVFILADGDADGELGLPTFRVFNFQHRVDVEGLDAQGKPLSRGSFIAPDQETMDAALVSLLGWARSQQRVVFEELEGSNGKASRETLSAWFGGCPLFEAPASFDEALAISELQFAGVNVTPEPDALRLEVPTKARSRVLGWVVVLLFALPLLVLSRKTLRRYWLDARGVAPETHIVEVRAEGVRVNSTRAGAPQAEALITGSELLGFAFSPSLGFDKKVSRLGPALRIVGQQGTRWLRLPGISDFGNSLRSVLISSTLRLRARRPELGLPFGYDQPTHCPFCSALFVFTPNSHCPSCGAPAGSGRHY